MIHPLQSVMPEEPTGPIETGLAISDMRLVSGEHGPTGPSGPNKPNGHTASQTWAGPTGIAAAPKRQPLLGGICSPQDALNLLNAHYLVGKSEQEVAIFRIRDDGLLTFTPSEQFKLDVANIFVEIPGRPPKVMSAEKFWKESPSRHQRTIVFKPDEKTNPGEFNLWRGFGVETSSGRQKIRRLLRHVWKVICRKEPKKFKYLVRWLAWAVQNPDKQAGVVIVLKSRREGTGKSTLGAVMLKIFGQHGALLDDADRLLGRFNDWLEPVAFILAEEILWAGDHKTADKLKSRVTADTFQIERKNGAIRQIPNRVHMIMTTNHEHAIAAGVGDRRFVVYDVSDEHACDRAWFDPLYRDLEDGGCSEFLWFLRHAGLGNWHPRQILKTQEAIEQQRMTGDSISQWSQACVNADALIGDGLRQYDLGDRIAVGDLRSAYSKYCTQQGIRPANEEFFGMACADMFGPRKRMSAVIALQSAEDTGPADPGDDALDQQIAASATVPLGTEAAPASTAGKKKRPWGYDIPDGDKWQEKIDGRLGIKK